jgi:hypothetical protein
MDASNTGPLHASGDETAVLIQRLMQVCLPV